MYIKYWLLLVALLWLPAPALAAHQGSAPTDPSQKDDEHFVEDVSPRLDTGCTFRSSAPLIFKVKIDRYVGELKPNGSNLLNNPSQLVANKVISPTVKLVMPSYDVDFADGEVDRVIFNGYLLPKPLQGSNGTWYENEFDVPVEWVKFPDRGAAVGEGFAPTPVENEIKIDIDTNEQGWCTAIDWAEVKLKAMAPLLLIHGIGANPHDAWEVLPGVTDT